MSSPSRHLFRVACCAALCFSSHAVSAAGLIDPSFASNGAFVSGEIGNSKVEHGLVDHVGRYVAVGGRFLPDVRPGFILRLTPSGVLDTTFGGDGDISLTPPPGYTVMELHGVAQRPDGRLVIAGHVSPTFGSDEARPIVCRLLEDGSFDATFGTEGCTMPVFGPLSPQELVHDIALQANGRIVLVGQSQFGGTYRAAAMRLLSNGERDLCFDDPACDTGGAVIAPALADPVLAFNAVAIAPDQKIVIAGISGDNGQDMAAVRLLPSGAIDMNFGNAGSRDVDFGLGGDSVDRATSLVVLPNGDILLSGLVEIADGVFGVGVAKLLASGVPDFLFGQTGPGRAATAFTDVSVTNFGNDVALQPDGKIIVGGTSYMAPNQANGYFAAWRLLPNGHSDPTFGTFDGRIVISLTDNATAHQIANTVVVDDDHVVLMGSRQAFAAAPYRAAVLRLDQHGVFADGYEEAE